MAQKNQTPCAEKFKTMIGGQALIEGIMMRGPEKDAIVVRTKEGLKVDVKPRKVHKKGSFATWPLIRGVVGFFDAQFVGIQAIMQSADLAPEEMQGEQSKLDQWLDKKLSNEKFRNGILGVMVAISLLFSIGLFFVVPMLLGNLLRNWIHNELVINLLEGVIRMVIFAGYMLLVSTMKDMKRVFAYHGAEHKTIRCYEAGLPLTVENVQKMTRLHPRCGTSFLLVVMLLSILVFSVASSLLGMLPGLDALVGSRLIKIVLKLALIPLVVAIAYEINRLVGRYDNWFTRILTAPGMWMQKFTTQEPDDSMVEVGIAAVEAVLPEKEGDDKW